MSFSDGDGLLFVKIFIQNKRELKPICCEAVIFYSAVEHSPFFNVQCTKHY